MKQVVEEVLKLFTKIVSDEDDVVPQINFVLAKTFANGSLERWLFGFDFFQTCLNLLLERLLKVKLVKRVERHHGVKQVR